MAEQVAKLVTTVDMNGNTVTNIGEMSDDEMNQTLELAKNILNWMILQQQKNCRQPHLIPSVILLIIQQPLHQQMEQILNSGKIQCFHSVEMVATGTVHGLLCGKRQRLL